MCNAFGNLPGCPNVGYTFSLSTAALSGGAHTLAVTATDSDAAPDTGSASVTILVGTPQPPTNSVSPSSGTGTRQTFQFIASTPNGYQDVGTVQLIFNFGIDGGGACYLYYTAASNWIALANDAGSAWAAGGNPGSPGVIANSQCSLDLGASSWAGSGPNLILNLSLTFLPGLPGPQEILMASGETNTGMNTGWQQLGTWTTTPVAAQPPTIVSASPVSGTGMSQTFSYTFASENGNAYIAQVFTRLNSALSDVGGCSLYYDRFLNRLYLGDDTPAWTYSALVGSAGTLSNAHCTVNTGQSSVTASGNNLTVNWVLSFNSAWSGIKNNYAYVNDRGDNAAGWTQLGVWTAGPAQTPPFVWIDAPTATTLLTGYPLVSGWAIDNISGSGSAIANVQVIVDNAVVATATYGVNRQDVCNAFGYRPGCPNVGYNYYLNATALAPGAHTLLVKAQDSDAAPDAGAAVVPILVGTAQPPANVSVTPSRRAMLAGGRLVTTVKQRHGDADSPSVQLHGGSQLQHQGDDGRR
ncbi:MAG: hypothetical protein ABSC05_18310, partial [Candidatus Solibacter sp.]